MTHLTYTLLTDGSSDKALIPILNWVLSQHKLAVVWQWADLRLIPQVKTKLADKVELVSELYPADVLFIHRDAETESVEKRRTEIETAVGSVSESPPYICVIPVRMQEAWLLFDETALRYAAGNPNGRVALDLPALKRLEDLPDPKTHLYTLLKEASELTGRRLKKFNPGKQALRVPDFIDDFSPLRALFAFQALEAEVAEFVSTREQP